MKTSESSPDELARFLSSTQLFSELSGKALLELVRNCQRKKFPKGRYLLYKATLLRRHISSTPARSRSY